jgi:two-component sensor histidine kinase
MIKYFFIFCLFFSSLFSENLTLTFNDTTDIYNDFKIEYLKDNSNLSNIKDIEKKEFKKITNNGFTLGYSNQKIWIKINILNKSKEENFILTLNETFYEKANLYYKKDNRWIKKENGLFIPIKQREIKYNKLSFKLNLPRNYQNNIYLELKGKYAYFGEVSFYKENYFRLKNFLDMNNLYIFIFGTTFIILIFSIGLSATLKEKIYYYYLGYTLFNLIYLIKISGLLCFIDLQKYIYILHSSVAFLDAFLILFSLEYLNTKKYLKRYDKLLRYSVIPFFLIGFILFFDYQPWNQILNALSLFITIIFLPLSIYIFFKGYKRSVYYTFALLIYFFLAMIFMLMLSGLIEYNNLTRYGLVYGTALENIIFSIMIISRYNEIKNEQIQYQKELLSIKNEHAKLLKKEVKKRTNELTIANNKLSRILKERELLLKEILHRVKNNFHMILGILWFESKKYKEKDIFSDLINRIKSMSKTHEYLLYTSENLKNIKVKEYFKDIIESISSTYTNKKITINFSIGNIELKFDDAISLSIIINEIVNNSIKHHPDSKNINIFVSLEEKKNKILLKIKDNGEGFNIKSSKEGLGLKLINDFSKKLLNSNFNFEFNKGTIFILTFEKKDSNEK